MEDIKLGQGQQCPVCKTWNHSGLTLPFECVECTKPLITNKEPVAEVPCSVGLKALRPKGEPHPAMISIYAYADEIEDKDPERADAICEIALDLEIKLWHLDKGF